MENMFQKILIIGSPGAGKSTFARKLSALSGLPLVHLDLLWHNADRTCVPIEVFDARLDEVLKRKQWIIDGNYTRTMRKRLESCDTVFFLDYPLDVCLAGMESRIGKPRPDMPWIEQEFDEEFRQYIIGFPRERVPMIYKMLEEYKESKRIIIMKSREDAESYLRER